MRLPLEPARLNSEPTMLTFEPTMLVGEGVVDALVVEDSSQLDERGVSSLKPLEQF